MRQLRAYPKRVFPDGGGITPQTVSLCSWFVRSGNHFKLRLVIPGTNKPPAFRRTVCVVAERGGFEPPVQFNPYGSLANYWFKPLTHLSVSGGKYNRRREMAIPVGFEPTTACLEGRCSIQLSYGIKPRK